MPTLQQQLDACASLSTCEIVVPPGIHVVQKGWSLRDKLYLTIRGTGTVIWQFDDPAPAVCLDTTGAPNIVIDGPTFALGNSSKRPDVLWLHGRPASKLSQTRLCVANAKFQGWFNKATVAFLAVENELFQSVDVSNGVPNTPSLFLSRANEIGAASQFGAVRVDPVTMTATNHTFINCAFAHDGHAKLTPPETNDLGFGIVLGTGVHDLIIIGGSTSGGARGGVMRVLGPDNRRISIAANWESKSANAAIVIDGEAVGLSVSGGLLMAKGPAVQLNGAADGLALMPLELRCDGLIRLGPQGKLTGRGLLTNGLVGQ